MYPIAFADGWLVAPCEAAGRTRDKISPEFNAGEGHEHAASLDVVADAGRRRRLDRRAYSKRSLMPRHRSRRQPSRSCSTPGSLDRARRMANHRANARREISSVRLVSVADGLRGPRNVAFTPDGRILIAELAGRVLVRGGVLLPEPLVGWPVTGIEAGALQAAIVHPQFATNRSVYLYYVKNRADKMTTLALARARLEDTALSDVREIFVADAWVQGGPIAGRAVFGPDGTIYLHVSTITTPTMRNENESVRIFAQHLDSDVGKVLRIRDDGAIPADNPFVGRRQRQSPRCSRTGIATSPTSRGIRRPASSGPLRSARWVATSSTFSALGTTTAGRSCRSASCKQEGPLPAALVSRRDGHALHALDAVDQPINADVGHGRQACAVARPPVRRRIERSDSYSASRSTSRRLRPSGGIRCSCRSADAGGMSCKGLTAICTR